MNNILSRNNAEKRFKVYGFLAVSTAIVLLGILLFKIFSTGISAFNQSYIGVKIEINNSINSSEIDPRTELRQQLRNMFPELTTRAEKRTLYSLFSSGATYEFEDLLKTNEGKTINDYYYFLASDDVDMYVKGTVKREGDSAGRLMSDQLKILDQFEEQNLVELHINKYLLAGADSREPEMAGIKGAIYGTFYAILIAFITSCLLYTSPSPRD